MERFTTIKLLWVIKDKGACDDMHWGVRMCKDSIKLNYLPIYISTEMEVVNTFYLRPLKMQYICIWDHLEAIYERVWLLGWAEGALSGYTNHIEKWFHKQQIHLNGFC